MTDTDKAIAAFLAKGGKVNKAAEGEGAPLSVKQWHGVTRDANAVKVLGKAYMPHIGLMVCASNLLAGLAFGKGAHYSFRCLAKANRDYRALQSRFGKDCDPDMFYYAAKIDLITQDILTDIAIVLEDTCWHWKGEVAQQDLIDTIKKAWTSVYGVGRLF